MLYYVFDYDKFVGDFTESQLIEYAEEENLKDQFEYISETRLASKPDFDLDEAIQYLTECCELRVVKGEEL